MSLGVVLCAGAVLADNWPRLNGGGLGANSSPTVIGTNLGVHWMVRLDPQARNSRIGHLFTGSMRSKNIVLRDGEIALLAPVVNATALAF